MDNYVKSWLTFADVTTIHGIRDLVFANAKLVKLLWATVLVGCMGLLAFQLYQAVKGFNDGETYFITSVEPMDSYPPIRIIPDNAISPNKTQNLRLSTEHVCFLLGFFKDRDGVGSLFSKKDKSDFDQLKTDIEAIGKANNLLSVFDLAEFLAYDPEKLLNFTVPDEADVNVIASKVVDTVGVSYEVVASRKTLTKYLWQAGGKWNITIHDPMWKSFPIPNFTYCSNPVPNPRKYGLSHMIAIGDDHWDSERWFLIKSAATMKMTLKAWEKRLINKPDNPCQKGTTPVTKCILDCKAPSVYLGSNYLNGTPPNCSTDGTIYFTEGTNRVGNFYNSWYNQYGGSSYCNQSIINQMEDCAKNCKQPCQQRSFTVQLNEILVGPAPFPDFASRVHVFMEAGWTFEVVEEAYVYTPIGLMSTIGGLMGLFAGASVISILQFLVYAIFGSWLEKKSAKITPQDGEGSKDQCCQTKD